MNSTYILHFNEPLSPSTAQHYVGWTVDLDGRLQRHRAGNGGRLPAVFKERGIDFVVGRVWTFQTRKEARHQEWLLKHVVKQAKRFCAVCSVPAMRARVLAKSVSFYDAYRTDPKRVLEELGVAEADARRLVDDFVKQYPAVADGYPALLTQATEGAYAAALHGQGLAFGREVKYADGRGARDGQSFGDD